VDWPPLLIGGAHWSSAYGHSRPRRLAATTQGGRGAHRGSVSGLTRGGGAAWRPGDDNEEAALDAGGARVGEKRRGVGRGVVWNGVLEVSSYSVGGGVSRQ
jgi:hypothetical protein